MHKKTSLPVRIQNFVRIFFFFNIISELILECSGSVGRAFDQRVASLRLNGVTVLCP